MQLIDSTYFDGLINLPLETLNTYEIDQLIQFFEKEILTKALGQVLYKEFATAIDSGTPAQKWLDLKDGADFTINGITVSWNGLVNDQYQSLIAYYAYTKIVQHIQTRVTAVGTVDNMVENSMLSINRNLTTQAYNEFLRLYGGTNTVDQYVGTLYNFMYYTDQFDNWIFTDLAAFGKKNLLNI